MDLALEPNHSWQNAFAFLQRLSSLTTRNKYSAVKLCWLSSELFWTRTLGGCGDLDEKGEAQVSQMDTASTLGGNTGWNNRRLH